MLPDNPPHILIVDDQDNWRRALSTLLKGEGYRVSQASNFEQAQSMLGVTAFHVVVLDIRLVDEDTYNVDGLGLLNIIRTKHPGTRVIVLTGYADSLKIAPPADVVMFKAPDGARFDSASFKRTVRELVGKAQVP